MTQAGEGRTYDPGMRTPRAPRVPKYPTARSKREPATPQHPHDGSTCIICNPDAKAAAFRRRTGDDGYDGYSVGGNTPNRKRMPAAGYEHDRSVKPAKVGGREVGNPADYEGFAPQGRHHRRGTPYEGRHRTPYEGRHRKD